MLNFVNADIDAVVRAIGQYTEPHIRHRPAGQGHDLAVDRAPGHHASRPIEQLLTALRLQGFTIVQTGNVARVVPEADAKLQGGAVDHSAQPGAERRPASHAGVPAAVRVGHRDGADPAAADRPK